MAETTMMDSKEKTQCIATLQALKDAQSNVQNTQGSDHALVLALYCAHLAFLAWMATKSDVIHVTGATWLDVTGKVRITYSAKDNRVTIDKNDLDGKNAIKVTAEWFVKNFYTVSYDFSFFME